MPLPLTVSCFSKIHISLSFWYRLTRVVPDKGPLNMLCVCAYHKAEGMEQTQSASVFRHYAQKCTWDYCLQSVSCTKRLGVRLAITAEEAKGESAHDSFHVWENIQPLITIQINSWWLKSQVVVAPMWKSTASKTVNYRAVQQPAITTVYHDIPQYTSIQQA